MRPQPSARRPRPQRPPCPSRTVPASIPVWSFPSGRTPSGSPSWTRSADRNRPLPWPLSRPPPSSGNQPKSQIRRSTTRSMRRQPIGRPRPTRARKPGPLTLCRDDPHERPRGRGADHRQAGLEAQHSPNRDLAGASDEGVTGVRPLLGLIFGPRGQEAASPRRSSRSWCVVSLRLGP